MNILNGNQLNELPADTPVWMIVDKRNTSRFYLRVPLNVGYEPDIIGFLEKEDAEQIIDLLKNHDAYRNLDLCAESELLIEVRRGALLYDEELYFFDHQLAQDFFTLLPESLENYKG